MSDKDPNETERELTSMDTPSGGGMSEDWLATILGLAILALALLGLLPDAVLW